MLANALPAASKKFILSEDDEVLFGHDDLWGTNALLPSIKNSNTQQHLEMARIICFYAVEPKL